MLTSGPGVRSPDMCALFKLKAKANAWTIATTPDRSRTYYLQYWPHMRKLRMYITNAMAGKPDRVTGPRFGLCDKGGV